MEPRTDRGSRQKVPLVTGANALLSSGLGHHALLDCDKAGADTDKEVSMLRAYAAFQTAGEAP